MSQHRIILKNGRMVMFGYDRPLGEYFLTEFYTDEEARAIENDKIGAWQDSEVLFSIMSHTTTNLHPDFPSQFDFSNGEIVELLQRYKGNIESGEKELDMAIDAISLDIPF